MSDSQKPRDLHAKHITFQIRGGTAEIFIWGRSKSLYSTKLARKMAAWLIAWAAWKDSR